MAVVQISRVQIRRGRKNSSTGIPQLASGELGWAVDSQELYIGNGSVAEGAPFVGNTEILTEHSNILALADEYQYLNKPDGELEIIQTGTTYGTPEQRTLQDRLDDRVSVRAFGVKGTVDISINDTDALQRAIDQLFINDATKGKPHSRVILNIEAGLYKISEPLRLPPYAEIRGAGKDKTIIEQIGDFPVAYTVNSTSTPGEYSSIVSFEDWTSENQPVGISLRDLTLRHIKSGFSILELYSTKKSSFINVKFKGMWESNDTVNENESGVNLFAKSSLVTTDNNIFLNCEFEDLSHGALSKHDVTLNIFEDCVFTRLGAGVLFGDSTTNQPGQEYGPRFNTFKGSLFKEIDTYGIYVNRGTGNTSYDNRYISVGNEGGDNTTAVWPAIRFDESGNLSELDYFERSIFLSSDSSAIVTNQFVSEVGGSIIANHKYNHTVSPLFTTDSIPLFRLGGPSNLRYKIHYLYRSSAAYLVRQGSIYLVLDKFNNVVHLTDEYDATGSVSNAENLKFSASFDNVGDGPNGKQTINVNYTNLTPGDSPSTSFFSYWYETIS
jgi:hypothetical protein